jgi:oligoribonuclease NrnB/cAMP/cGMP phosphodiesterase (DHH superfamily)
MFYKDLSDFISKTSVSICETEEAVIVVGWSNGQAVTLYGFRSDANKSNFEIQEEGYLYLLKLEDQLNHNKSKMKHYCVYHSRDLDGYTSGAIIKMAFNENNQHIDLVGYDYGQPFPYDKIEKGSSVVMVDVSLPMPEMEKLAEYTNFNLTWIDHHLRTINEYILYKENGKKEILKDCLLDANKSACELAWQYYYPSRPLPEAVHLLGQYDTWRNHGTKHWESVIHPFQYGMRMHCSSPETFPYAILKDNEFLRDVIKEGSAILKYQEGVDAYVAKGSFVKNFKGYKAILINGAGFNKNSFKSVYDENKHDLMMAFRYNGKFWVVSIYTSKDIDCSSLAASMGGGGHKEAAGFQVDNITELFLHLT